MQIVTFGFSFFYYFVFENSLDTLLENLWKWQILEIQPQTITELPDHFMQIRFIIFFKFLNSDLLS